MTNHQLAPHLMFQDGRAEEAMTFYIDLFGGEVLASQHYGAEHPEMAGKLQLATFRIADLRLNIMDSAPVHEFGFTPAISLSFVCESEEELEAFYGALLTDGFAMMPKDDYGFGPFGWVADRFGVSWQLSVAPSAL